MPFPCAFLASIHSPTLLTSGVDPRRGCPEPGGLRDSNVERAVGKFAKVETQTGELIETDLFYPANPPDVDHNDHTGLVYLSDATLLYNTKVRYAKDEIYTFVGPILVSVSLHMGYLLFNGHHSGYYLNARFLERMAVLSVTSLGLIWDMRASLHLLVTSRSGHVTPCCTARQVNPFKYIPSLYSPALMNECRNFAPGHPDRPAHTFSMAEAAYKQMIKTKVGRMPHERTSLVSQSDQLHTHSVSKWGQRRILFYVECIC